MDPVRGAAAMLCLGLLCAACDRRVEPFVEGEQPRQPDLSRIFPEGAERAAQEGSPGAAAPSLPPLPSRGAPPVAAAEAAPIRGTIVVAEALRESVPEGGTLFVIARRGDAGPPLAVKRFASPRFPLEFALGPEDRMIQAMPFTGPLQLTARLDADGNATTRTPGDLQGSFPKPVGPGAARIELVLDEVL